ncbi:MAG TPA: LuxR C-terminal-related transcriptional regulator [Geminicoccaceae bacterium]
MVRFECLVRRSRGIDPIVVRSGQGLIDGTGPAERWQHLLDHLHPDDRRHFRPPRSLARPARRRVRLRAGDEPYRSFQLAHRSRPAEPRGRIWEGILAEAGPEDPETRLATIADHLPAALYRCEVEGRSTRCTFVSAAVADVFGISVAAYREDPARMLDNIHPDDRQGVIEAWHEAAEQQTIFDCEFRIVLGRGREQWVRSVAQMTPGRRGVVLADGIATDVTRRRLVQEQLEQRNRELLTLCRISEIALNSPSVASGLEQMAREIARHMNFPTAVIAIYDESDQVVTVRGRHNVPHLPPGPPVRLPIRHTLAWEVIRTGRPLIENDALGRSEARFTYMHKARHQTFVGVPVKVGERAIGCLGLGHPDRLDPPPALIELLSSWADAIASFIASKGQEELLAPRPSRHGLEFEAAFASRLTARQREVLAILKSGRSNRSIAEQLGLQEATVKIHVRAILKALGVRNRTQAAMIANSVEPGTRPRRGAGRRRGGRVSDGR